MEKSLGTILCRLRKEKSLTQSAVSIELSKLGFSIQTAAISKWEKDLTMPNASQFLALCEIYEVADVMAVFAEKSSSVSKLNDEGKRLVSDYVRVLIASGLYKNEEKTPVSRLIRLYDLPASAGLGQYLDDSAFSLVEAPGTVPKSADFGVFISGDSMEPAISDGEIIWIKASETLDCGKIGLFYYNDNSYCKRLECIDNKMALVSINREYSPIFIEDGIEFQVFGEVVATT